jgi:hypothetical protein
MNSVRVVDTDHGTMTPQDVVDHLTYASYRANRNLGMSAERLAGFFGEEPSRLMEDRYRKEQRT